MLTRAHDEEIFITTFCRDLEQVLKIPPACHITCLSTSMPWLVLSARVWKYLHHGNVQSLSIHEDSSSVELVLACRRCHVRQTPTSCKESQWCRIPDLRRKALAMGKSRADCMVSGDLLRRASRSVVAMAMATVGRSPPGTDRRRHVPIGRCGGAARRRAPGWQRRWRS